MKISRSYLLGLGSGLILSALIAMVLPQGTIRLGNTPLPSENQAAVKPDSLAGAADPGQASSADQNSSGSKEPLTGNPSNAKEYPATGSNPAKSGSVVNSEAASQVKQAGSPENKEEFIIPAGATAEKIADLLVGGGFITKKEEFLAYVKEKKLESKFNRGSFQLSKNMSVEEIVGQLIR